MRPRAIIYAVLALLLAILLLANLHLLTVPLTLNVIIAQLTLPLGVLVLMVAGLVFLVDLAAHALARRSWGQDRRALAVEMEELRARAEDRESARLVQLQAVLERELAGIRFQLDRLVGTSRPPPSAQLPGPQSAPEAPREGAPGDARGPGDALAPPRGF